MLNEYLALDLSDDKEIFETGRIDGFARDRVVNLRTYFSWLSVYRTAPIIHPLVASERPD